MESPIEAQEHVAKVVIANADDDGGSDPIQLIELMGLGEFEDDVCDVINVLAQSEQEMVITSIISGDPEAASDALGNALFVALLTGYRLGCSHTAERASFGKEGS